MLQDAEDHIEACRHYGDHAHELDEDIERRTGSVLEGVSYSISYHCGLVGLGAFAAQVALLNVLLGIVPGTAGVGHEDGKHETGAERADQQADRAGHTEEQAYEYRLDMATQRA